MKWIFLIASLLFLNVQALQVHDLFYRTNLSPGDKHFFYIMVYNEKDTPEEISLEPSDFYPNNKSGWVYEKAGSNKKSNAAWLSCGSDRITLEPHERKEILCHIEVPNDKTLQGSYWSLYFVQAIPHSSLDQKQEKELQKKKIGMNIQTNVRYAFAIVTNIGTPSSNLKLMDKQLKKDDKKMFFCVDIKNQGHFFIQPKISLKLFNSKGDLAKSLESSPTPFYPGYSNNCRLPLENLEKGKYKAFLVLEDGTVQQYGESFELSIP